MKTCHVCNALCEDDMELCPVCGAELLEETALEEDNSGEEQINEELNKVINNPQLAVTIEDVVSAEIFMDILKDNNIAFVNGNLGEEAKMHVIFGGGFIAEKIYVAPENLEATKKLYEDFLNSEEEFGEEFIFEEE